MTSLDLSNGFDSSGVLGMLIKPLSIMNVAMNRLFAAWKDTRLLSPPFIGKWESTRRSIATGASLLPVPLDPTINV
jgi:hypothetical protein